MNKVEKIFEELRKREIIDKGRKLEFVSNNKICKYVAKSRLKNKIIWNKILKSSDFADDHIKFMLLHEEGHFRHFCFSDIGAGRCFFYKTFRTLFLGKKIKKELFHKDEFVADLWATSIMTNKLCIKNIVNIAKESLFKLRKFGANGKETETHPSYEERINRLKKIYC